MMHQHTQVWLTAAASIRSSWSLFQICGGFLAKSSFPVSVSNCGNNYRTSVGRPQWDAETAAEDHRLVFVLKPQWLKKWAAVFFRKMGFWRTGIRSRALRIGVMGSCFDSEAAVCLRAFTRHISSTYWRWKYGFMSSLDLVWKIIPPLGRLCIRFDVAGKEKLDVFWALTGSGQRV